MPSAKSLSRHSYRTYPAISKIKSTTFKSRSSYKNAIVGDVGIPRGSASTLSPVPLLGSTNPGSFGHCGLSLSHPPPQAGSSSYCEEDLAPCSPTVRYVHACRLLSKVLCFPIQTLQSQ